MRTERRNTKAVMVYGIKQILYRGKGQCWFLHMDEALHHSIGRTGHEALRLITGDDHVNFPFYAMGGIQHKNIPITKGFRAYLKEGRLADVHA